MGAEEKRKGRSGIKTEGMGLVSLYCSIIVCYMVRLVKEIIIIRESCGERIPVNKHAV